MSAHHNTPIRIASECCLICGIQIGYHQYRPSGATVPDHFDTPREIREHLSTRPEVRSNAPLYCAREVENVYHPVDRYLWMAFYRLIIHHPDTDAYTLSGVGLRMTDIQVGYVPWDQSKAFIDRRETGLSTPDLAEDSMTYIPNQDHDPIGYPMHMHCWTMARATGQINEPGNLGIFCQILWNEWTRCKDAMEGTLREDLGSWGTSSESGFLSYRLGCRPPGVIAEDFLRITAIKKIMDTCKRSPVGPFKPRIGRNWKSLPVEIQLLILEKLHPDQIEHLLKAYRDAIPGAYWWHTICRTLKFEENVLDDPDLDLDTFGFTVSQLGVTDYTHWDTRWQWSNRNKISTFLTRIDEKLSGALNYGVVE